MKTTIYFISENAEAIAKAKTLYENDTQFVLKVLSPVQWDELLENANALKMQNTLSVPTLSVGINGDKGGKVLNFKPSPNVTQMDSLSVETMDKMEARAIEAAISQFKGNLTEAAKALGIGRATLYRKVKHYQIDTSQSRRKKVA